MRKLSEVSIAEAGGENAAAVVKNDKSAAGRAAEAGAWKEGSPKIRESTVTAEDERNHKTKEKTEEIEAVRKCMLLHLEQMKRCGVALYLDGRSVLPGEAVAKAVREDSPYMADYVLDSAGAIEQVRFDKVTRC